MAETKFAQRRRFARIPFRGPAVIEHGSNRTECLLLDVSLKGALIEVPAALVPAKGSSCSLTIRLGVGPEHVTMTGSVAHVTGLHVGVSCDQMDLDSASHLRRLVELNLGDETLLQRELEALVSWGDQPQDA